MRIEAAEFAARREALAASLAERALTGCVLFDPQYVAYYTGFAFISTERPIAFVHDFATQRGGAERTALALHILASQGHSSVAATLFDGVDPNTAQTKFYSELELEGIK